MALSESRKAANQRWTKANYTSIKFGMPNSEAEAFNEFCAKNNLTKAGFIRQAIKEKMERDSQS